jgi:hypothetical protein
MSNQEPSSLWESDAKRPSRFDETGSDGSRKGLKAAIGILVLLIAAGASYFYFFGSRANAPRVGLEFGALEQIFAGAPFPLSVSASNLSEEILQGAKLSVFLPDGVFFVGESPQQRFAEKLIGDIGPGSITQAEFNIIATSDAQSVKRTEARLTYSSAKNPKYQFERREGLDVSVGQAAVALTFETPPTVFSGEAFEMVVKYRNNSLQSFKNLRLKLNYPPAFQFERASVPAKTGNNEWDLGNVSPAGGGDFSVFGKIVGPEKSFFNFEGVATADFSGQTYPLSKQTASISIYPSPLVIQVAAGSDVARPGQRLRYTITFRNNASIPFKDVVVRAKFLGKMFDFTTADAVDGVFDSVNNVFSWGVAQLPELLAFEPGEERTVRIDIEAKKEFPIRTTADKNYTLDVEAQIESPTVPQGTAAQKTISTTRVQTKVAGVLEAQAKALWKDAPSKILNTGPYPPKVNTPTRYTVHWIAKSFAADFKNVHFSAFLQSGARFTGAVKSNVDTVPSFNTGTGEVTWDIKNLPANKGVINTPAEAIFQVELTPAVTQVGQYVTFLGETKVRGEDSHTGQTVEVMDEWLTTQLKDDTGVGDVRRFVEP